MSNISGIVGGVVALALVNRLLDRKDTTAPTAAPKPLIKEGFVTGPAAGNQDFTLIKPITQITPKQLEAFTPDRPVTRPTYDPKAMVAQPIRGGGPFKLNLGNKTLADILQGRR